MKKIKNFQDLPGRLSREQMKEVLGGDKHPECPKGLCDDNAGAGSCQTGCTCAPIDSGDTSQGYLCGL